MRAFVGADRDRPLDLRERLIAAVRQRLFHQHHAGLGAGGEMAAKIALVPALIGIDHERGPGRGGAHRGDACGVAAIIAIAAELDLEQCAGGDLGGGRGHGVGRRQRDRKSGGEGVRGGQAGERVNRAPAALGLEVPERAVERIAGGPGRHRVLQSLAVETGGEPRPHGLDLRHHAVDGFAVAGIGNAFAAAARLAVAQFCDHHHGLGFGTAADGKGTGDRPVFGGNGEG